VLSLELPRSSSEPTLVSERGLGDRVDVVDGDNVSSSSAHRTTSCHSIGKCCTTGSREDPRLEGPLVRGCARGSDGRPEVHITTGKTGPLAHAAFSIWEMHVTRGSLMVAPRDGSDLLRRGFTDIADHPRGGVHRDSGRRKGLTEPLGRSGLSTSPNRGRIRPGPSRADSAHSRWRHDNAEGSMRAARHQCRPVVSGTGSAREPVTARPGAVQVRACGIAGPTALRAARRAHVALETSCHSTGIQASLLGPQGRALGRRCTSGQRSSLCRGCGRRPGHRKNGGRGHACYVGTVLLAVRPHPRSRFIYSNSTYGGYGEQMCSSAACCARAERAAARTSRRA